MAARRERRISGTNIPFNMLSRRFAGQTLQNRKLLISDPQELLSTDRRRVVLA
jgi:hypothetical protein